jgi:hypothetical protein
MRTSLYSVSFRALFTGALLAVIAAPVAGTETLEINAARQSITGGELLEHVSVLAADEMRGREAGSPQGSAAGDYLMQRFARLGLAKGGSDGTFAQRFGNGYRNIIGILPGSDPELQSQYVIVGAHYDHVGTGTKRNSRRGLGEIHNGADDNASGTAGLLELAEAMTLMSTPPRRSIVFFLFDGEEKGMLGSKHWLAHPTVPPQQVAYMVNLDMIGRLRENKLVVIGTRTSIGMRQFVSEQNREIGLKLEFPWKSPGKSDHTPFAESVIPVLMLNTGRHDDLHTSTDDIEKINSAGMQRVSRLLLNIVWGLANDDSRRAFRLASLHETDANRELLEQPLATVLPDKPARIGMAWREDRANPGVMVLVRIAPGSRADHAGLLLGDRVFSINGQRVAGREEFARLARTLPLPISLGVERSGRIFAVVVGDSGDSMRAEAE